MQETAKDLTQAKEIAEHVCRMLTTQMQCPSFSGSSVPISVAARVMGKDETYIRKGIEDGWLPIGVVRPPERKGGRHNYYVSPKLFWELTGYVWQGEAS